MTIIRRMEKKKGSLEEKETVIKPQDWFKCMGNI